MIQSNVQDLAQSLMGEGPPQNNHHNWLILNIPGEAEEITSGQLNFTKRNNVKMQKMKRHLR